MVLVRNVLGLFPVALASAAFAGPVGIDGSIGAEWTGANIETVAYSATASEHNFGAPTGENTGGAYEILTRQDAQYIYIGLRSSGVNSFDFSNLYLGTDAAGSKFGFEVTNDRAFVPGVSGYHNLSPLDGTANEVFWNAAFPDGGASVIELAVPFSFFTNDPLAMGTTFNPGDVFRLRLSQTFGYSVAGGTAAYGDNRLGTFVVPVPLPPAAWSGLAAMAGVIGFSRLRRRSQR